MLIAKTGYIYSWLYLTKLYFMKVLILHGGQMTGKTLLANFIMKCSTEMCVIFEDVNTEKQIINLATSKHRIPYSSNFYDTIVICTNLELNLTKYSKFGLTIKLCNQQTKE